MYCSIDLVLYNFVQLERWADCVRDYEVLRKELPSDKEVAEALFHAQIALKATRGEDVSNMKFGGEVEIVTNVEQLRAAIGSPGELFTATYFCCSCSFSYQLIIRHRL
jgi:hypothetical protein